MTAIAAPTILNAVPGPGEHKKYFYVMTGITANDLTYDASGEFTTIYQITSVLSSAVHTRIANTVSGTTITTAGWTSSTEIHYVEVTGV